MRGCLLAVLLLATACGTDGAAPTNPTIAPSPTTSVPEPAPTGSVTVTIGDITYDFHATRCIVGIDVFVIDGVAEGGATLAIRHASPPTRPEPQPSMSYLLIEPEPDFASPPAAVQFDAYDPDAGVATGWVDDATTFSAACER